MKTYKHDLCPYPCLYSLDPLHLTQEYALQYIDLSNIFEFPAVVVSASNNDVTNLEDVLRL